MQSEWRVMYICIGTKTTFTAYRKKNIEEKDCDDNREWSGEWKETQEEASLLADKLNKKEIILSANKTPLEVLPVLYHDRLIIHNGKITDIEKA